MEATDDELFANSNTRVLSVSEVCMVVGGAAEDGAKECVLADGGLESDVFVGDEIVILGV